MILFDRLLVGGVRFVLDKIARAAEAEGDDEGRLREELLLAQLQLDEGAIDEGEYRRIEREIVTRMRAARRGRRAR